MFTMKVFPTKLNLFGEQHYMCEARIEGVYDPVTCIAKTRMNAVVGGMLKVEAKIAAVSRFEATRLHVDCMCSLEEESQVA